MLRRLALILMLAVCEVAFADVAGTVLGTITDSSGAVIPNVPVVLSNAHTGFNRVVKTNGEGEFQFLAVPVGSGYEISVTAPGFEKAVHSSLTLLVNQVYRTDFQLQIGSTEQSVVVSEAAAQVETTSTQSMAEAMWTCLACSPVSCQSIREPLTSIRLVQEISLRGRCR